MQLKGIDSAMTITDQKGRKNEIAVIILLIALVLAIYWPVAGYDFIALDDNLYLLDNLKVQHGLSMKNVIWAMTTFEATNWHPLTWLSLMADYDLFKLNPAGYHLMNLLLHLLNAILLFWVWKWMTNEIWRSAAVAALFAVHPLNIESVVWIAERKNLLSTLWGILTIMAYVRYTGKPEWKNYALVLVCYLLGLMAKPMLVTLPFVLLLLDFWPLKRYPLQDHGNMDGSLDPDQRRVRLVRLCVEKAPLMMLSLCSAFVTFRAAQIGGSLKATSLFPFINRVENAIISYVLYLYKLAWPSDLSIFYPYPVVRPVWQVGLCIVVLAIVTLLVLRKGRNCRYLVTGWLWYVITLLPVIGIVQVGYQSIANRYAYIPVIGIFVITVWGTQDFLNRFPRIRLLPAIFLVVVIISFAFWTKYELPNWENSERVFQRALNVTDNNHIAEIGMGNVWFGRKDLQKAASHYREALRIKPDYAEAHNNLGMILIQQGQTDAAETQYRQAIKNDPIFEKAYNNLGVLLAIRGNIEEAKVCFIRALELNPEDPGPKGNLKMLIKQQSRFRAGVQPEP
jgi:protein O-mannosyl-transferase